MSKKMEGKVIFLVGISIKKKKMEPTNPRDQKKQK